MRILSCIHFSFNFFRYFLRKHFFLSFRRHPKPCKVDDLQYDTRYDLFHPLKWFAIQFRFSEQWLLTYFCDTIHIDDLYTLCNSINWFKLVAWFECGIIPESAFWYSSLFFLNCFCHLHCCSCIFLFYQFTLITSNMFKIRIFAAVNLLSGFTNT